MHIAAVVDSDDSGYDVGYDSYDGDDSYDVDYDSYDGVDGGGKQYVYVVDVEDDTDDALIMIVTTKEIDAIDAVARRLML